MDSNTAADFDQGTIEKGEEVAQVVGSASPSFSSSSKSSDGNNSDEEREGGRHHRQRQSHKGGNLESKLIIGTQIHLTNLNFNQ